MADRSNVIPYPGRDGPGRGQSHRPEAVEEAVGHLDELESRLRQLTPQPGWPPQRWMIASTSFRVRLPSARTGLADLSVMSPAGGQHPVRWALKFNSVRLEAERRLHDIDACLHALQRTDTSPADRARETVVFASSRSGFLRAVGEIRHLAAELFPAILNQAEGRPRSPGGP